jgi:hypothetical protein
MRDLRAGQKDTIGVTSQVAVQGRETQPIIGGEGKTGAGEMLACPELEIMAAIENVAQPRGMIGVAQPIKLDATCARMSDRGGAEIAAGQLRGGARVEQRVDRAAC